MSGLHSHLNIALQSIKCFTDDGQLDEAEVNYLLGLAMADGHMDDEEKRVLQSIFSKALEGGCSERTRVRIAEIRRLHSF